VVGRTREDEKQVDFNSAASNMRYLADKTATPETLKECIGLLRIVQKADIEMPKEEEGSKLKNLLAEATDDKSSLGRVRAGRNYIGLIDLPPEEIELLVPGRDDRERQLKIKNKGVREQLGGHILGVDRRTFHDREAANCLAELLSAFRIVVEKKAKERQEATTTVPGRSVPFIPPTPAIRRALDRVQKSCELADKAFLTPDLLLVLLELPNSRVRQCFDSLPSHPGLAEQVRGMLRRYLATAVYTAFPSSEESDWIGLPAVQRAQVLAAEAGATAFNDTHLFLGILEARSETRDALASMLGQDFELLRKEARRMSTKVSKRTSTPKVVGDESWGLVGLLDGH